MRVLPLVLVLVVLLAAAAGFRAELRRARRGQRSSAASVVALSVVLTFGLVALGATVGYALRGTALATLIGAGVAGAVILVTGPLVRAWAAGRLADRRAAGMTR